MFVYHASSINVTKGPSNKHHLHRFGQCSAKQKLRAKRFISFEELTIGDQAKPLYLCRLTYHQPTYRANNIYIHQSNHCPFIIRAISSILPHAHNPCYNKTPNVLHLSTLPIYVYGVLD